MYHTDLVQFRAARNRTLEMTEGLSQVQADFSPGSNIWSIGEILDHLLLSEQTNRNEIAQLVELSKSGRRPFISRTLTDVNFSPSFIPRSLLPFFELPFRTLNMFLPASVREFMVRYRLIPARNADITTPRKGMMITQLRSELDSSIKETTALFDRNPGLDYRAMILDHPLLGTNNVLQLLRILAAHERRHQDQIGDILRRAERPHESLAYPLSHR